jgi:hypothetical protein
MGLIGQYYGIESMNPATGKVIGKGMDPDRLMNGILDIKQYFQKLGPYRGDISLIVGLPHDDKASQQLSIDWLKANWQGQAVHIWPLGLPDDPMYNKLNAMSRDKEKYGYRPSTVPMNPKDQYDMITSKLYNWENDHWNYQEAFDFCKATRSEMATLDFRISCWMLGEQGTTNWQDILKIKNSDKKHDHLEKISDYKRKKIDHISQT